MLPAASLGRASPGCRPPRACDHPSASEKGPPLGDVSVGNAMMTMAALGVKVGDAGAVDERA